MCSPTISVRNAGQCDRSTVACLGRPYHQLAPDLGECLDDLQTALEQIHARQLERPQLARPKARIGGRQDGDPVAVAGRVRQGGYLLGREEGQFLSTRLGRELDVEARRASYESVYLSRAKQLSERAVELERKRQRQWAEDWERRTFETDVWYHGRRETKRRAKLRARGES